MLVEHGAQLDALMVILNGVVAVMRNEGKGEVELGRPAPGDYFGEGGLFTGSGETGAVQALIATVVYEVGQAALGTLMRDRPGIADEISVTLSRRTKAGSTEAAHAEENGSRSASWLVGRIRELFEVPHAWDDLSNSGCSPAARRRSCRRHGIVEYWPRYDPGSNGS